MLILNPWFYEAFTVVCNKTTSYIDRLCMYVEKENLYIKIIFTPKKFKLPVLLLDSSNIVCFIILIKKTNIKNFGENKFCLKLMLLKYFFNR